MSSLSFKDLPLEAVTSILELLGQIDRVALTSTCTTLRKHGAASPNLWTSLVLKMAEERLPQLAVWLDTKSSALQSLYLNLQLIDCDWAALEDALEPLTTLTSLQLTNDGGRLDGKFVPPTLDGSCFRKLPLRRLSLDFTSMIPLRVDGTFHLLTSLESLELSSSCSVPVITLPRSLTGLSFLLELENFSIAGWEGISFYDVPGLRELRVVCGLTDPILCEIDGSLGYDLMGEAEPVDSLDLGVRWFAPALEVLVVDCSLVAAARHPDKEGALALTNGNAYYAPPGLRSLTATHLGHSSEQLLQQLTALPHLTRLCLPECHLTGAPALLQGLTQLQELQLQGLGQADLLRPSLGPLRALPRLRRLSLAECSLAGLDTEGLGPGWPALEELDLVYVELPHPPPWLGSLCPQLTRLGLDIDAAAENCAQLASLTPLRRLDLHFSDTTLPGSAVFLRSIDSARTPSVLDGDNNPDLSALPWVRQVPAAVQALPSLEQVGLPAPGRCGCKAHVEFCGRCRGSCWVQGGPLWSLLPWISSGALGRPQTHAVATWSNPLWTVQPGTGSAQALLRYGSLLDC